MRWMLHTFLVLLVLTLVLNSQAQAQTTISIRQDGSGDVESLEEALDELPRRLEEAYVIEFQDSETYEETVTVDVQIRDGGSLTITSAAGQTPILRSDKNKKAPIILASSGVIVEGLILEGGDKQPGIHIDWSDNHTIRSCIIRGARQGETSGLYIQGGQNNLVINNDITDNPVGIELFDEANGNVIRNNRIYRNEIRGVWIYRESASNEILHNSLEQNGIEIHLGDDGKKKDDPGEGNRLSHNVVAGSSDGTLLLIRRDGDPGTLPPNTHSDFNLLFAPAGATFATLDNTTIADLGSWQSAASADVHSVGTDPLYVDAPNDLHLQSTQASFHGGAWIADGSHSPGIDAGDATAAVGDETDPNGGRVNLGAYGGTAQASRTGTAGPILPSGAFNGVVAITEGLGQHDVSIEISHPSGTVSRVRLEWATAEAGPFAAATLAGPVVATQGSPAIDNAATYQLSAIPTAAGSNTVTFRWNSGSDAGSIDGQAWLKVTANDGANDQQTPAILAVTVDNVAPQGLADLAVVEEFSSRAQISWTAATSETHFVAYSIWYGANAADVESHSGSAAKWSTQEDENLATISTSTTTITGLTRNTTYTARIWASDSYGNEITSGPIGIQTTNLDTVIHFVAASGSNDGVANDPGQPWNSIDRAVDAIPKDLVEAEATYIVRILDSSVYGETVTIKKTADATYNITVEAVAGQSPKLEASGGKMGIVIKTAYTTITGLSIEASNKWAINVDKADHVTIENCTLFGGTNNNQGGLEIHKSTHCRVQNNRIHTNETGVSISEDADFARLNNNLILDGGNRTYGVYIDKKADADTLTNNTIVGYQIGIYFRGPGNNSAGDGHVLRNNIVHDVDTGYLLDRDIGSTFSVLDYNDVSVRDAGNVGIIDGTTYASMSDWRAATGAESGSISLDPLFVDTASDASIWDLHLKSQAGRWSPGGFVIDDVTSPAIDAGDPRDSVGSETAPNGNRINLGVYGGTTQASRSGNIAVDVGGVPWGEYVLGGVPIVPADPNPDAVLGDDFPGLGEDPWGFWWRLVRWDVTQSDYLYYREDEGGTGNPPDFVPGLGYWLIQWWSVEENGEIVGDSVTVGGTSVPSNEDYVIPLVVGPAGDGFNQLANPFLFDIDFADARIRVNQGNELAFSDAAATGVVDAYAYLWDWEEGVYAPVSSESGGRIPSWRGFWIEQLDPNVNLELVLPPMEADGGVSRPLATTRVPADDWGVEFAVRGSGTFIAPEGEFNVSLQDLNNRAGVKPEGSRRFDHFDARDLQVLNPAYVYVYFPHDDPDDLESAFWPDRPARYTYDYRDPDWDEQAWLFVVETSLTEATFEWEWTNPDGLPKGFDLQLEDADADTIVIADLRQIGVYRFTANADTKRRFRLRVTYEDVSGDVTADRFVDTEDAQAILRHAVGIQPLEAFEVDLAEVTGNGPATAESVSAHDAALILRYERGLVQQLPVIDNEADSAERTVHLSEPRQLVDGSFTVDLYVDQADGILSGDVRVKIDTEELVLIDVRAGAGLPRAQLATKVGEGEWRFAFADAAGGSGRASLTRLHLHAPMAAQDVIEHMEIIEVELNEASVSARIAAARPETAFLYPVTPNPFNSSVQIRFGLPEAATLQLVIYNILGQRVRDLSRGATWPAGIHRVTWDGRNDAGQGTASGVYFVQSATPTWQAVQKLVLIR